MSRATAWLPGLTVLRHYDVAWLRYDIVAGLVVTTMLVPVGIAYAEASGIPGINGLYATIVPLLAYALVGPSRIIVLGPDSALAPLILAVVAPLAGGDAQRAVALGSAMAIVAGLVCLAAGLARLGFITELLSKPIRYGYMNGIALTVILSQVPKLLGFRAAGGGPLSKAAWHRARCRRRTDSADDVRGGRRIARGDPDPEAMAKRARRTSSRSSGQPSPSPCSISRAPASKSSANCRAGCQCRALPLISMSDVRPSSWLA